MQNRITGAFGTTQVGGMLNFRKVNDEYGVSLIGEARFPKRERVICERIIELYEMGELNFSFEIKYTEDNVVNEDGVMYIDVAEHNVLVGMAVVSVPAYQESFALSLTAEDHTEVGTAAEEANKGVENMDEAEMIVDVQETVAETIINEADGNSASENSEALACAEETTPVTGEATAEVVTEETIAEETVDNEEDEARNEEEEHIEENEEEKNEEDDEAPVEATAEADTSIAQTEVDWAIERAQYMALEAEVANLRAQQTALEAEIERLRACEAELAAINAAKEAERMINEQNRARAFAEKQGLKIENEAVASAIESLDYKAIAELAMAQETESPAPEVTIASYESIMPMKIKSRFENVLKRVSEN